MQKPLNETNAQAVKSTEGKQAVDLSSPGVASALAKRILSDIDKYCAETYDDGPRRHLGASLIGHECSRYLWFIFRWCYHKKHDGRQQRLFNRGHREEARFIEWLEGIGFKVWFEQPEVLHWHPESDSYFVQPQFSEGDGLCVDVTNIPLHVKMAEERGVVLKHEQYRISGVNGHFGGSLDGIAQLPERYGIEEPVLLEFKTNGTGAGFNKLTQDGMPVAKPQHFAQTSTYGFKYQFRYVVYLNINKNDDSLHVEVAKLDWKLGANMEAKAERVIMSQKPPARLSDNPTFRDCSWCDMKGICHNGDKIEVNCRSCSAASPVENGEWFCATHNANIPREYIPQACPHYKAITENV